MHFGVAFTGSAVFLFLVMRWGRVREILASRWWVNFFGHIPFVAMPMLWAIGRPRSPEVAP